ncbi:MAG: transposase, partial [Candidatus Heimdallarchaeota archaeon]|nr:transposase [Candidatus Heimdallarchaeota archaeon]
MMLGITSANLFPSSAVIHFRPERSSCPTCHEALKVLKTYPGKKAATLAIGNFTGHETVYYCQGCGCVFHSDELRNLIPEKCNFGYDIIVFIGESLFLRCRNYQEIRLELQQRNVRISESEIAFLAKKFVLYLGLIHRSSQRGLEKYMHMNGGYILHLDGTCDGGSPHLISVLDGISKIVLDNRKLPSENADDLIPFL